MIPTGSAELRLLFDSFYNTYDPSCCPEILQKSNRAYNIAVFNSHKGYYVCVPFRSNITHKYAYRFKKSKRSKYNKSGVDYKKMIIIRNLDYIDDDNIAVIDKDEYIEFVQNLTRIQSQALSFLNEYIDYKTGKQNISEQEAKRRYEFSLLQYFHKELGLTSDSVFESTAG